MCCESAPIESAELQKPEWARCTNCTGDGCAIYASRPEVCRRFECEWLKGNLPDNFWPAGSGILIYSSGFEAARPMADAAPPAFIVNFWVDARGYRNMRRPAFHRVSAFVHDLVQARIGDAQVMMQMTRPGARYVYDRILDRWKRLPPDHLIELGYREGRPLTFTGRA
jgi:hypothetical protein